MRYGDIKSGMEREYKHYKQPKMKQKDYFEMLRQEHEGMQFSYQPQSYIKQSKIKQGDLHYFLHKQKGLSSVYEGIDSPVVTTKSYHVEEHQRTPNVQQFRTVYKNRNNICIQDVQPKTRMTRKKSKHSVSKDQPRSILKKSNDTSMYSTQSKFCDNNLLFENEQSAVPKYMSCDTTSNVSHSHASSAEKFTPTNYSFDDTDIPQKSVNFINQSCDSILNYNGSCRSLNSTSSSNRRQLYKENASDLGFFITSKMSEIKLKKHGKPSLENSARLTDIKQIASPKVIHVNNEVLLCEKDVLLVPDDNTVAKSFMSQELLY